jgi:hypothetical protein
MITLKNNTIENDDWMKTLPGYQDEAKIHEMLAKSHEHTDEATKAARKAAGLSEVSYDGGVERG